LSKRADRLLLDLPCSGSGVWSRNPDGKWHLEPGDLARLTQQQQDITERYLPMLAPGGRALLCTCSVFADEGERHIDWLATHPYVYIIAHGRFDPTLHIADGFFWALLERH
jgi:16S rRNA (cytosine967-C5)-methyltransferase